MNANDLIEAGEILYGKQWKAPLARDLGLNASTLWRYLQKDKIPKSIELAVETLLAQKKQKL